LDLGSGKRNALAKGARLQGVETIGESKIVGALCRRMSKSELTLFKTQICANGRNGGGLTQRI
jgi:hypothetical protein